MYTIRCTRKLLRALKLPLTADEERTTTALGDWYANLIYFGKLRLVHFLSDRSLLSVIIPLKPGRTAFDRHRLALAQLLGGLQILPAIIEAELAEMAAYSVAPTASRSVLGSMRTLSLDTKWIIQSRPEATFDQISLELAGVPCLTLPTHFPDKTAKELLEQRHPNHSSHVRSA